MVFQVDPLNIESKYLKTLFPALCRKCLSTTELPRGSRDIESTQNRVADMMQLNLSGDNEFRDISRDCYLGTL